MKRILLAAAFVLSLSQLCLALQTKNWPEFRGPTANGHADAKGLPREWSDSKNIAWKTKLHDEGWSSPVVWGNQIWITAASKDGRRLYAICADKESGKILTDKKLFDIANPEETRKFNSFASPTPAIEEGRVYIHFGSYGTVCLSTKGGRILWRRQDLPCNHWRGPGSSPIIYKNLLIIHYDGFDHQYAVALDKMTGKTVWKTDRAHDYGTDNGDFKKAYSTPTVIQVGKSPVLISPAAKATFGLNPENGKEYWRIMYQNHSAAARPFMENGLVYVNNGFGRAELLAVNPNGKGDITRSNIAWKVTRDIGSKPSMIHVDGRIYAVTDKQGKVTCLDARTGEELWKGRLGERSAFSSSPLYADGVIYFFAEDGTSYVIQPGKEFKLVGEGKLSGAGRVMASPAVTDNSIIYRTDGHLYRIQKR